jgi:hypothetical protein
VHRDLVLRATAACQSRRREADDEWCKRWPRLVGADGFQHAAQRCVYDAAAFPHLDVAGARGAKHGREGERRDSESPEEGEVCGWGIGVDSMFR